MIVEPARECYASRLVRTPGPPKIIPTKIPWLNISGMIFMGMGIPPHKFKIMLESNPLKSRILVRRLAVSKLTHPNAWPFSPIHTNKAQIFGKNQIA